MRWLRGSTSALKTLMPCGRRQLSEHDRRDALTLPAVGDDERHLGPLAVDADVGAVADDRLLRAGRGDQRVAVGVVHVHRPFRHPIDTWHAEEAQAQRLERERLEERPHRRRVGGLDGPDAKGRAVPQRDVDRSVGRALGGGHDVHCGPCRGGRPAACQRRRRLRAMAAQTVAPTVRRGRRRSGAMLACRSAGNYLVAARGRR
jgi:hypothetical protein